MGPIRQTVIVMSKELRELLREANVLIVSLGFPFLFYPLLIWGGFQIQVLQEGLAEQNPPRVALHGPQSLKDALDQEGITWSEGDRADLKAGALDLVVQAEAQGPTLEIEILYRSTEPRSERGLDLIQTSLEEYKPKRLEYIAKRYELDPEDLKPWAIETENLTPSEEMTSHLLGRILPAMLVAVMLMAALYPAVAVAVGERDGGTLETTLVSAPQRGPLVAGKIGAILVMVLGAVIGNLGAMGLTVFHLLAQIATQKGSPLDVEGLALSAPDLAMGVGVLLAGALLAATLMVVVVLPTASFKEAQNVGGVVLTVGIGLAFIALMPSVELGPVTALIPIANLSLALTAAFNGDLSPGLALTVAGSSVALSALFLVVGARLVASESYLFRAALPPWLRWMERLRD